MAAILESINHDVSGVVSRVRESLVEVHPGDGSFGSGIICHPDGLIMTNAHVVHGPRPVVRLHDGRAFPARTLALDRPRDLAALVIQAEGLTAVTLGDSRSLRPGAWVLSLGHPWGINGAAAAGAVIGLEGIDSTVRPVRDYYSSGPAGTEWLVAALPLRPGHSGGPMVDAEGRLVGINTMITGPDIAMAVPVHAVKAFLRQAVKG